MPLSEKHTIPTTPGFGLIFAKPDFKLNNGNFFVLGKKNNLERPRLGVSIKKSDYRLAVQRNAIKRKIKNSFRKHAPNLPCLDFVVLVRPGQSAKEKTNLDSLWIKCL
tara:strand:- start:947 stop:1270 length:324 start_codon:yes stop_codon:yes gene_type:complete